MYRGAAAGARACSSSIPVGRSGPGRTSAPGRSPRASTPADEEPLAAALREFEEETGTRAARRFRAAGRGRAGRRQARQRLGGRGRRRSGHDRQRTRSSSNGRPQPAQAVVPRGRPRRVVLAREAAAEDPPGQRPFVDRLVTLVAKRVAKSRVASREDRGLFAVRCSPFAYSRFSLPPVPQAHQPPAERLRPLGKDPPGDTPRDRRAPPAAPRSPTAAASASAPAADAVGEAGQHREVVVVAEPVAQLLRLARPTPADPRPQRPDDLHLVAVHDHPLAEVVQLRRCALRQSSGKACRARR